MEPESPVEQKPHLPAKPKVVENVGNNVSQEEEPNVVFLVEESDQPQSLSASNFGQTQKQKEEKSTEDKETEILQEMLREELGIAEEDKFVS